MESRRPLTAEEKQAGSDDPAEQSAAILEESADRTADRNEAPDSYVEHRSSDEATPPVE